MDKDSLKSRLALLIQELEDKIDSLKDDLEINFMDYTDEECYDIEYLIEFTRGKVDGFEYVIRMLDCEEEV